jgi:hypothetical protein
MTRQRKISMTLALVVGASALIIINASANADGPTIPLPLMGCDAGNVPLQYLGGEKELDGGFKYRFVDPQGYINTVSQVPNGFDATTATDDELALYGFDPRPNVTADLDRWTGRYTGLKYLPAAQPCITPLRADVYYNNIWAGKGLNGPAASFASVSGSWTMPIVDTTTCQSQAGNNQGLTNWVGLTGKSLLQDGFNSWTGNEGWYEYLNGSGGGVAQIDFTNSAGAPLFANGGDVVSATTSYNSQNYRATFTVTNKSQGNATRGPVQVGLGLEWWDGTKAVWITERPTANNGPQYLPNASPVVFTAATASSASGHIYGGGGTYSTSGITRDTYQMVSQNGNPNSTPLENAHNWQSPTTFQNNWAGHCG